MPAEARRAQQCQALGGRFAEEGTQLLAIEGGALLLLHGVGHRLQEAQLVLQSLAAVRRRAPFVEGLQAEIVKLRQAHAAERRVLAEATAHGGEHQGHLDELGHAGAALASCQDFRRSRGVGAKVMLQEAIHSRAGHPLKPHDGEPGQSGSGGRGPRGNNPDVLRVVRNCFGDLGLL